MGPENATYALFRSKKVRFIFALGAGLLFSPLLFFVSFPIGKLTFTPVGFLYDSMLSNRYQTASDTYEVVAFMSIISLILVILSIFLSLKRINNRNAARLFFVLPIKYLIVVSPIFLFHIFFAVSGFVEGGEASLVAILAIVYLIDAITSVVPIIFISLILFLWFKHYRIHAVILFLLPLLILPITIQARVFIQGCAKKDYECLAKRAIENNDPEICEKAGSAGYASDLCFNELAFVTGDPSYCRRIKETSGTPPTCFARVERKKQGLSICDDIICNTQNFDYESGKCLPKDICYAHAYERTALETGDATFCEKATSYTLANGESIVNLQQCYSAVGKNRN